MFSKNPDTNLTNNKIFIRSKKFTQIFKHISTKIESTITILRLKTTILTSEAETMVTAFSNLTLIN